jgi:Cu(I)/Ag(I) efflux system membrane fusion protein
VRIELKNPDLALLPGMFVDVEISAAARSGLAVPREAVVETGERRYVFVALGGGRFSPREVALGVTDGEAVEITSGLAEGEEVALSAGFLLDSESRLRGGAKGGR